MDKENGIKWEKTMKEFTEKPLHKINDVYPQNPMRLIPAASLTLF
jgi:hypothetical protein